MGPETKLEQRSGVRRRSVASNRRGSTPPVAPVATQPPFARSNRQSQPAPPVRSMSVQQRTTTGMTPANAALDWLNLTNPTISRNALSFLNMAGLSSDPVDEWSDATSSSGSTNASAAGSRISSRRPSGNVHTSIVLSSQVAKRLAHLRESLSPPPNDQAMSLDETPEETQDEVAQETQPARQEAARDETQNDAWQAAPSTSTSGYSVQRLPTLAERMVQPEAILLTELVTNITGLLSTLVESGPIDYATGRAVGPLGFVNAAQLFESNWANAGGTPVSRVGVLASIGSGSAAVMSTWTGWWSNEAADFHSRFGALAGIASEIADVRDAWAARNDNPARSAALLIRILSIWAASISTFLSISEAENEGSMAPTYGLSASVLPVVGTLAGATAEALNRESVRTRLRALVERIRSLIRWLMHRLGYGEPRAPLMDLDPSPV